MSMQEPTQRRLALAGERYLQLHSLGEGPLVVLCHGFPGHWSNWWAQMQALAAAGFCAVAPDMCGYGQSYRPEAVEGYDMNAQIGDMCGLLDALGEVSAVFVGQDFGASLVWSMAQRMPERVRAVVGISVPFDHDYYGRSCMGDLSGEALAELSADTLLVASPLHPPSVGFKAIARQQFLHAQYFQTPGPADRELGYNAELFLQRIYWALSGNGSLGDWSAFSMQGTGYLDVLPPSPPLPWPWMSEAQLQDMAKDYLRVGPDRAFTGALASYRVADRNWQIGAAYVNCDVEVPALFVAGDKDPVVASMDEAMVQRLQRRIPDLRGICLIADAGHFVQLEAPEHTNRVLLPFLQGLE